MAKYYQYKPAIAGQKLPLRKVLLFLLLGTINGFLIGSTFMGTIHAMLETNIHGPATPASTNGVAAAQLNRDGSRRMAQQRETRLRIHTLCTSNGSPYQNYQTRIAYATYKLILPMAGGDRHVAFTRILHRTKPDNLMDEVPTFRAEPLQPKCDDWCEYPVSDRANAVHQFFDAAAKDPSMIKAPWIYMVESDYVFMVPLQPPSADTPAGKAFGFPFQYIKPTLFPNEMKKLWPEGNPEDIPNTGPAPLLMRTEDWIRVTPEWEKQAAAIEADAEMKKKLGWVREMYGFSIALAKEGIDIDLAPPGQNRFISQPPLDASLGKAHAFHYTQCTIYKTLEGDKDVWKYDKRFYTDPKVVSQTPLIEEPPKFVANKWKFIEGALVTEEKHDTITEMILQMNRGIARLKELA